MPSSPHWRLPSQHLDCPLPTRPLPTSTATSPHLPHVPYTVAQQLLPLHDTALQAQHRQSWSFYHRQGKGLLEEVPLDKRWRLGRDTSAMGRLAAPSVRSRRALSDANAGQVVGESMSNASSNNEGLGTQDGGLVEFRKEDVNALLNEKIKAKTKFDFKGECKMMIEYIRKLRACVKWYLEQEELHDAEREKHAKTVGYEYSFVNELNQQLEELTCTIDELRKNYTALHEKFLKDSLKEAVDPRNLAKRKWHDSVPNYNK